MQDHNNKPDCERRHAEDKLQQREIAFGGGAAVKKEKMHGKVYRWLDNFWYHHKWKTIICLFLVIVLVVCTVQLCTRPPQGDMTVIIAGPYNLMLSENGVTDMAKCLAGLLPEDYDQNGIRQVDISAHSCYSEAQIKALAENKDEYGVAAPIIINTQANSANYRNLITYIQTGDASVMLLDPWLVEELKNSLKPINAVLDTVPTHAVSVEINGQLVPVGISLGNTTIYKENDVLKVLPPETIVCLAAPIIGGNSAKADIYARSVAFYKALVQ